MAQLSQTSITGQRIAKAYAARLANEVVVMPYCKSLTESVLYDGAYYIVNNAGIPTPNASPTLSNVGGTGPTGTGYAYYITFYDQTRDREGNGVISSGTINVTDDSIRVTRADTNGAANSTVTHWRVYRNLSPSGSIYYRVATVAIGTTTYDDSATDATISANDTLETDNTPPASGTYGIVDAHKARMIMLGPADWRGGTAYDHSVTWSKTNEPWAWPAVNEFKVEPGRYGIVRGGAASGDRYIVYKDQAIYEWHWNQNPSGITGDGFGKTVNNERGALNHRCIVNVQGVHYVLDQKGIYAFSGGTTVVSLSERLSRYWPRINFAARERFTGVATEDRVYFFVALDADTECKFAFVLDLTAIRAGRGPRWYVEQYSHGIRDACRFMQGNNTSNAAFGLSRKPVALIITEYGYVGALGIGFRDFVDPQLTATGTATSGSTTTLTDTGATFTRTNEAGDTSNVVGAYITITPSSQAHFTTSPNVVGHNQVAYAPAYITACTGTQVTFTPALTNAVAAGATYVIGGIPNAVYKTPLLGFGMARARKRAGGIELEFQPGGHNFTIGVGTSKDRRGMDESVNTSTDDPYTTTAGGTLRTVDMGGELDNDARVGFTDVEAGDRAFNYLQVILDATGVDKPAIVDSLTVRLEAVVG